MRCDLFRDQLLEPFWSHRGVGTYTTKSVDPDFRPDVMIIYNGAHVGICPACVVIQYHKMPLALRQYYKMWQWAQLKDA